MNATSKGLIILDGYFGVDYVYVRSFLDEIGEVSSLSEFASLSNKFFQKRIKGFNYKNYEESFTEKAYLTLIETYAKSGVSVITEFSSNYPKELKEISFRPICLYLKGNASLLQSKNKFSIVGSRKTLPSYLKITEDFSKRLSSSGVVIVTGVAGGGDLSAIKGAIGSGNLICVSASGFDHVYKEYTRDYIDKIIEKGLLICEKPPKVKAMPYFYPVRNRIIAGLGKGVLVISGSSKSGTRHTYNYALEYGKDVFSFPYGLGVTSGEICNEIIKEGGYLVTSIEDITSALNFELKEKEEVKLNDREKQVLSAIKSGNYKVDDIILATNYKVFEVLPTLTCLEIKGLIVKNGGEYQAVKN